MMSNTAQVKYGSLYECVNLNTGKGYAGKDSNPVIDDDGLVKSIRPGHHRAAALRGDTACRHLYNSMRKHGVDAFYWIHHPDLIPVAELPYAERRLIKARGYTDPSRGYNLTDGGENVTGWHHVQDTKDQIGASNAITQNTPEMKAKHSAIQKEVQNRPDVAAKRNAAMRTPEARKRKSIACSGEKNGFYGKRHTENTKEVLRMKATGRKHSKETIDNMKAAQNRPDVVAMKSAAGRRRGDENHAKRINIILAGIAVGKSQKCIAKEVGVSTNTIRRDLIRHRLSM